MSRKDFQTYVLLSVITLLFVYAAMDQGFGENSKFQIENSNAEQTPPNPPASRGELE